MICRETGWSLEYVRSLGQYDRLLMLGWKPVVTQGNKIPDVKQFERNLRGMLGRGRKH